MANINKQDVTNVTADYIKALKTYEQLVQEHGLIITTEIIKAYEKVEKSHERYIDITNSYIRKSIL